MATRSILEETMRRIGSFPFVTCLLIGLACCALSGQPLAPAAAIDDCPTTLAFPPAENVDDLSPRVKQYDAAARQVLAALREYSSRERPDGQTLLAMTLLFKKGLTVSGRPPSVIGTTDEEIEAIYRIAVAHILAACLEKRSGGEGVQEDLAACMNATLDRTIVDIAAASAATREPVNTPSTTL